MSNKKADVIQDNTELEEKASELRNKLYKKIINWSLMYLVVCIATFALIYYNNPYDPDQEGGPHE